MAHLVRDQLCLWEVPKTGSAFAAGVLVARAGAVPVLGQHVPAMARALDASAPDAPLHVGTLRAPRSWYRSLWRHLVSGRHGEGTRGRFRAALDAFAGGTDWPSFLRAATELAPDWRGGFLLEEPWRAPPAFPVRGLWSWTVRYMLTDWRTGAWLVDALLPLEASYRGLGTLLGGTVTPEAFPPRNVADVPHPPEDPEEWARIRAADGALAWWLGYDRAASLGQPAPTGGLVFLPTRGP